jgi:hypothetical protein
VKLKRFSERNELGVIKIRIQNHLRKVFRDYELSELCSKRIGKVVPLLN